MKKLLGFLLIILTLSGCGSSEKTVETIAGFRWGVSENELKQWHSSELEELNKKEFESSFIVRKGKYHGYDCDILYVLKRGGLTTVYYDFFEETSKNQVEQYKKLKEALSKEYGTPVLDEANAGANMRYAASWDAEGISIMLSLSADAFFLNYSDSVSDKLAEELTSKEQQQRQAQAEAAALKEAEDLEKQKMRDEYQGIVAESPLISLDNYSEDVRLFAKSNGMSLTLVMAEVSNTQAETDRKTLNALLGDLKAAFLGAIDMDTEELSPKYDDMHVQFVKYCEISVEACDYIHKTLVISEKEYNQTEVNSYISLMAAALQELNNKWVP